MTDTPDYKIKWDGVTNIYIPLKSGGYKLTSFEIVGDYEAIKITTTKIEDDE